jgi:hypothetical protein
MGQIHGKAAYLKAAMPFVNGIVQFIILKANAHFS